MKGKTQRRYEYQERIKKAEIQKDGIYEILRRIDADIARWKKAIRKLGV